LTSQGINARRSRRPDRRYARRAANEAAA